MKAYIVIDIKNKDAVLARRAVQASKSLESNYYHDRHITVYANEYRDLEPVLNVIRETGEAVPPVCLQVRNCAVSLSVPQSDYEFLREQRDLSGKDIGIAQFSNMHVVLTGCRRDLEAFAEFLFLKSELDNVILDMITEME